MEFNDNDKTKFMYIFIIKSIKYTTDDFLFNKVKSMSAGTVFGCVLLITKKYDLEIDLLRHVILCVSYHKTTKMQSLNVKQFFLINI